jgi:hypothetical protein
MKSFLILCLVIGFSFESFAIRHVGNGGGEAEMSLLQMTPFLPMWAKACNENKISCGINGEIPDSFIEFTKSMTLAFAEIDATSCAGNTVTMVNRDLYESDEKTAKSEATLTGMLLAAIGKCSGSSINVSSEVDLSLQGKEIYPKQIYLFSGAQTDVIVGSNTSALQATLVKEMNCDKYRLVSVNSAGFIVRCQTNQAQYNVYVNATSGTGVGLTTRFVGDDDP